MKEDEVTLDVILRRNEDYISVTYGCMQFLDCYGFESGGLHGLAETLQTHNLKILKKRFPDKWHLLNKKLAYLKEYLKSIEDYNLPVNNSKRSGILVN